MHRDNFSLIVTKKEVGWRLDHFLVHHLPDFSRSQLGSAIKSGDVLVNDQKVKAGRKLQLDDVIKGVVAEESPTEIIAQHVDFQILFEDDYLIILSKPPDLVVHPAAGNPDRTLVNGLVYHCSQLKKVGDPLRPGIVHRLDKDTSGVMVVAKTPEVMRKLFEMFKQRLMNKSYLALVHGMVDEEEGRIVAPIGRHPVNRKKMAINHSSGKFAATTWRLKEILQNAYSLLEVEIETGRTHQIRLHLASIGYPVAGDVLYGSGRNNKLFPRQMLHSAKLSFNHPVTGRKTTSEAPLYPDFATIIEQIRSSGESH